MKKKFLVATALLVGSVVGAPALAAENPMDHAGIQHNMYLGCLMDLNAPAKDSLVVVVEKCGYDPGMPLERFVALHQPTIDAYDPSRPLSENLAGMRKVFSAYEFSFIERMDKIAENAEDMDVAARQLEALEREAIDRLDAKSDSGALILGGLSVARHSNRYWSKRAAESGEFAASGGTTAKRGGFWKWLSVVFADVGGFVESFDVGEASSQSQSVHAAVFKD
ncbi:hypothetical protein [Xanthomonas sacchari]|uniref:hypothetical protein n=1 Tax=Xanthomonas sacchari TaxID=56458 RepID=UPI003527A10E